MKRMPNYNGDPIIVLEDSDLAILRPYIDAAADLWRKRCREYYEKHGDVGSCVLGAGITVDFLPKGCRKYRRHMIIAAHDVCCCQGSCTWEVSKDEILKFLADHGVTAHYEYGRMD